VINSGCLPYRAENIATLAAIGAEEGIIAESATSYDTNGRQYKKIITDEGMRK
jgi:hypothetical protein